MTNQLLHFVCPKIKSTNMSELEVLGSAVWLWQHSSAHSKLPIYSLNELLLPPIKLGQYVLIFEALKPVGYIAWASLSPQFESIYLSNLMRGTHIENWHCGSNIWITDWVAPFGYNLALARIIRSNVFPNTIAKSIYHKDASKIKIFKGSNLI